MDYPYFGIKIENNDVDDVYKDIIRLEIEFDWEMAAMLRLRLALPQENDGSWRYLDDERLGVWNKIAIRAGFESSGLEEVFSGYITHAKPVFLDDPDGNQLEIWGMDATVLMDRIHVQKDWPNKKDSDIASAILGNYGLSAQVEDTSIVHDENVSTIMQNETDIRFLRRLAERNGYECYVHCETAYFGPPLVGDPPQGELVIHGGDKTNLNKLALEVNALSPSAIGLTQVDRLNKEISSVEIKQGQFACLGTTKSQDLLKPGIDPALFTAALNPCSGEPEMTEVCQKLFHDGDWFVTGEGEISSARFPTILRNRRPVTIKGVGERFSGDYYVTHVNHIFTGSAYTQFFKVVRNGLGFQ
jgi:phage protein D